MDPYDFFSLHFIKYYDEFVKGLTVIFPEDVNIISEYELLDKQEKLNRGIKFNSLINTNELFDLLINSKIKLFSHKDPHTLNISSCLFNDKALALKNIINNKSEELRKIIWYHIQRVYLASEVLKPMDKQNKERIGTLSKLLFNENVITQDEKASKEHSLKILQDVRNELSKNTNNATVEMFDDIIKTFETLKDSFSDDTNKKQQMMKILSIGKKLTNKYKTKLTDGTIEINKIMDTICKSIPELASFAKMFGGVMPKQEQAKERQERIIIDEDFSTAQVPLGKPEEEETTGIKIGDALKVADKFGVLPFGNKETSENNNFGFGEFGEIFEMIKSGKDINENQIESLLGKAGISKEEFQEIMENINNDEENN